MVNLAQTHTRKMEWIALQLAELRVRQEEALRREEQLHDGLALAQYAERMDLIQRYAARLEELRVTLKNIRWALAKLRRGEVY